MEHEIELIAAHLSHVMPEPYDDEDGHGYDPLDRWGDRRFDLRPHRWSDANA